jgi:hypothetical protein
MRREGHHPSDQDLLLWADGELSSKRAADIREHLTTCRMCRDRMTDLEEAITDFVRAYRREVGVELPPVEGPRALLRARLAEHSWWSGTGDNRWFGRMGSRVAALLSLLGIGIGFWQYLERRNESRQTYDLSKTIAIPNAILTPGATASVSVQDVCGTNGSVVNDPAVPDPLKQEVLKEYGLNDLSNNAYEIDYLVTPRLGGTASIRNLWPQPSLNTAWNARAKDALEDRLHYLVCSGQLDLTTAQREISLDWIAAYKKYFRTNEPLHEHSGRTTFLQRFEAMIPPVFAASFLAAERRIQRPRPALPYSSETTES